MGRVATHVAKLLLNGHSVILLNAEEAAMSGHVDDIVTEYKRKIELKDKANPDHSPYFSRRPDLFVKRIVRGMLPFKKARGKEAYKRLRVYIGVPDAEKDKKVEQIKIKDRSETYEKTITIKELSERLGYRVQ